MTWARLNLVVEGQTEEEFAKNLLRPHLAGFRVEVKARMVGHRRDRCTHFGEWLARLERIGGALPAA